MSSPAYNRVDETGCGFYFPDRVTARVRDVYVAGTIHRQTLGIDEARACRRSTVAKLFDWTSRVPATSVMIPVAAVICRTEP